MFSFDLLSALKSVVLFLTILLFSNFSFAKSLVEKTVAIVNGEVILDSDLSLLKEKFKTPGFIDETLVENSVDSLKKNRSEQLRYLIHEKLLISEIKRLNLSITKERVEQEIKDLSKKSRMSYSDFISALKTQGMSLDEYKSFLKEKMEKQSLIEVEVISKLKISDDEAYSEYLKTHPNRNINIDEFSVSHIFFSPKRGSPAEALTRANTVLQKLNSGESFEALAEQHSEDPNFVSGGFLGAFKAGEFIPEIEKSIQSLSVGETSSIIKSKQGYHIVKLISKKLTQDPQFIKEKDRIKAKLFEALFKDQFRKWLQDKEQSAFIKINT